MTEDELISLSIRISETGRGEGGRTKKTINKWNQLLKLVIRYAWLTIH